jgi:hypothetical protein
MACARVETGCQRCKCHVGRRTAVGDDVALLELHCNNVEDVFFV